MLWRRGFYWAVSCTLLLSFTRTSATPVTVAASAWPQEMVRPPLIFYPEMSRGEAGPPLAAAAYALRQESPSQNKSGVEELKKAFAPLAEPFRSQNSPAAGLEEPVTTASTVRFLDFKGQFTDSRDGMTAYEKVAGGRNIQNAVRAYIQTSAGPVTITSVQHRDGLNEQFFREPLVYAPYRFTPGRDPQETPYEENWGGMTWHLRRFSSRLNTFNRVGEHAGDTSPELNRFRLIETAPGQLRVEPVFDTVLLPLMEQLFELATQRGYSDALAVFEPSTGTSPVQHALEMGLYGLLTRFVDAVEKQHGDQVRPFPQTFTDLKNMLGAMRPEADASLSRLQEFLARPEVTGGKGIRARVLTGLGRQSYDALVVDQIPSGLISELAGGLSPLLSRLNSQGPFTWGDVAGGLGAAQMQAKLMFPDLSTILADVIRWTKKDFDPVILAELEKQAADAGFDLWSRSPNFLQANAQSVDLRTAAKSPLRLITMMNALAYNEDPLRILANLYNQLEPDGILVTNLYIPVNDARAGDLVKFYEKLQEHLNLQGVAADFRILNWSAPGTGERNSLGESGPFFEYSIGIVLGKQGDQRLEVLRQPESAPVLVENKTVRDVTYHVAWYGEDPAQAIRVVPAAPRAYGSQEPGAGLEERGGIGRELREQGGKVEARRSAPSERGGRDAVLSSRSAEPPRPGAEQMIRPRTEPTNQVPFSVPPSAIDGQSDNHQQDVQSQPNHEGPKPEVLAQHTAENQSTQNGIASVDGDLQQSVPLLRSQLQHGHNSQGESITSHRGNLSVAGLESMKPAVLYQAWGGGPNLRLNLYGRTSVVLHDFDGPRELWLDFAKLWGRATDPVQYLFNFRVRRLDGQPETERKIRVIPAEDLYAMVAGIAARESSRLVGTELMVAWEEDQRRFNFDHPETFELLHSAALSAELEKWNQPADPRLEMYGQMVVFYAEPNTVFSPLADLKLQPFGRFRDKNVEEPFLHVSLPRTVSIDHEGVYIRKRRERVPSAATAGLEEDDVLLGAPDAGQEPSDINALIHQELFYPGPDGQKEIPFRLIRRRWFTHPRHGEMSLEAVAEYVGALLPLGQARTAEQVLAMLNRAQSIHAETHPFATRGDAKTLIEQVRAYVVREDLLDPQDLSGDMVRVALRIHLDRSERSGGALETAISSVLKGIRESQTDPQIQQTLLEQYPVAAGLEEVSASVLAVGNQVSVSAGQKTATLPFDMPIVKPLLLSPDQQLLVVRTRNGNLYGYDLSKLSADGTAPRKWNHSVSKGDGVRFSDDGRQVLLEHPPATKRRLLTTLALDARTGKDVEVLPISVEPNGKITPQQVHVMVLAESVSNRRDALDVIRGELSPQGVDRDQSVGLTDLAMFQRHLGVLKERNVTPTLVLVGNDNNFVEEARAMVHREFNLSIPVLAFNEGGPEKLKQPIEKHVLSRLIPSGQPAAGVEENVFSVEGAVGRALEYASQRSTELHYYGTSFIDYPTTMPLDQGIDALRSAAAHVARNGRLRVELSGMGVWFLPPPILPFPNAEMRVGISVYQMDNRINLGEYGIQPGDASLIGRMPKLEQRVQALAVSPGKFKGVGFYPPGSGAYTAQHVRTVPVSAFNGNLADAVNYALFAMEEIHPEVGRSTRMELRMASVWAPDFTGDILLLAPNAPTQSAGVEEDPRSRLMTVDEILALVAREKEAAGTGKMYLLVYGEPREDLNGLKQEIERYAGTGSGVQAAVYVGHEPGNLTRIFIGRHRDYLSGSSLPPRFDDGKKHLVYFKDSSEAAAFLADHAKMVRLGNQTIDLLDIDSQAKEDTLRYAAEKVTPAAPDAPYPVAVVIGGTVWLGYANDPRLQDIVQTKMSAAAAAERIEQRGIVDWTTGGQRVSAIYRTQPNPGWTPQQWIQRIAVQPFGDTEVKLAFGPEGDVQVLAPFDADPKNSVVVSSKMTVAPNYIRKPPDGATTPARILNGNGAVIAEKIPSGENSGDAIERAIYQAIEKWPVTVTIQENAVYIGRNPFGQRMINRAVALDETFTKIAAAKVHWVHIDHFGTVDWNGSNVPRAKSFIRQLVENGQVGLTILGNEAWVGRPAAGMEEETRDFNGWDGVWTASETVARLLDDLRTGRITEIKEPVEGLNVGREQVAIYDQHKDDPDAEGTPDPVTTFLNAVTSKDLTTRVRFQPLGSIISVSLLNPNPADLVGLFDEADETAGEDGEDTITRRRFRDSEDAGVEEAGRNVSFAEVLSTVRAALTVRPLSVDRIRIVGNKPGEGIEPVIQPYEQSPEKVVQTIADGLRELFGPGADGALYSIRIDGRQRVITQPVHVVFSNGRTKLAVGVNDENGLVGDAANQPPPVVWEQIATGPSDAESLAHSLAAIQELARSALEFHQINPDRLEQIGFATTGFGDFPVGRISMKNLQEHGFGPMQDLKSLFERALENEFGRRIPVFFVNDGLAGVLGEHNLPEGVLSDVLDGIFVILGGGVGSGEMEGGQPVYAVPGVMDAFLNEIGWHIVTTDGGTTWVWRGEGASLSSLVPRPAFGEMEWSLEQHMGGPFLAARAVQWMRDRGRGDVETFGREIPIEPDKTPDSLSRTRRPLVPALDLQTVVLQKIAELGLSGDPAALEFIRDSGRALGAALRSFREKFPGRRFAQGRVAIGSSVGEKFGAAIPGDPFLAAAREAAGTDDIVRSTKTGVKREWAFSMPTRTAATELEEVLSAFVATTVPAEIRTQTGLIFVNPQGLAVGATLKYASDPSGSPLFRRYVADNDHQVQVLNELGIPNSEIVSSLEQAELDIRNQNLNPRLIGDAMGVSLTLLQEIQKVAALLTPENYDQQQAEKAAQAILRLFL